jgi:hypothetical protein
MQNQKEHELRSLGMMYLMKLKILLIDLVFLKLKRKV